MELIYWAYCRVALDGSQVLCHMPPAKTYCAEGNYENITRSISNHRSLDQDNTALLAVSSDAGLKFERL
jgi:alpha-mannosidase